MQAPSHGQAPDAQRSRPGSRAVRVATAHRATLGDRPLPRRAPWMIRHRPPDSTSHGFDSGVRTSPPRADAVASGNGTAWWREGWRLFTARPASDRHHGPVRDHHGDALFIPVLGSLTTTLLAPVFAGGVLRSATDHMRSDTAAPDAPSGADPPQPAAPRSRAVASGNGVAWWSEGWRLFAASPGVWIAITVAVHRDHDAALASSRCSAALASTLLAPGARRRR